MGNVEEGMCFCIKLSDDVVITSICPLHKGVKRINVEEKKDHKPITDEDYDEDCT